MREQVDGLSCPGGTVLQQPGAFSPRSQAAAMLAIVVQLHNSFGCASHSTSVGAVTPRSRTPGGRQL